MGKAHTTGDPSKRGFRLLGWTRALVLLTNLLACCSCAFALDPSLDISQYAHTAWKVREGFSKGRITSVAQTPDGYLWLGTEFGLLRFDGVRNISWQPPEGEHLPSNYVRSLLAVRDGTLWIGTLKGLASLKDGKLTQYPELVGQTVDTLLLDREGTLWAAGAVTSAGRLCAIQGSHVQCYGDDGGFGRWAESLYEDSRGNLWVGAETGLWHWRPGSPKLYPMPKRWISTTQTLNESDNGIPLIATPEGLRQLVGGKGETYHLPGTALQFRPNRLLRDRNGGLWIGTENQGLLHVHQGRTDLFAHSDGLSDDFINRLFEDREGNIWVVTRNGLDRFRDFPIPAIFVEQGLPSSLNWSVLAPRDGSVWIGSRGGLSSWKDGQITIYHRRNAQSANGGGRRKLNSPDASGSLEPVHEITDRGLPDDDVESLFQDDPGRIWVSTPRGVVYFENGRFIPVKDVPGGGVYAIAGDRQGNLWISHDSGLFHLARGDVVEQIPWARLGAKGSALALVSDPLQGGLWLGFAQGGVVHFKDSTVRASYAAADGLGGGRVNGLQLDREGTLWAATMGGLSRLKNGHVATLTSKNGLPCDTVVWEMEDDAHSFWLYTPCGLVRIARPELDAWVTDPNRTVQVTVFDSSDGVMLQQGLTGGYSPRVAKSPDGKLWFVSLDGVSVIDPRHLAFNQLPPPVHIEQVTADRKTYWQNFSADETSSHPKLPPLVRDLTIDFTALSLVEPEKVHFRFKLEGQDKDWREVVNQRRVEYSNLPPRNYRFRVIASNNSGVWNHEGASLDFAIAPAYYQTNWFRALCVAAFVALLWAAYQVRVRQLRRQERKLRDVVETIPAIAWTALPDGWVDFSNHHWEEYTGLSLEKGAGSGWEAAVHPEDVKRHAEKWRASVASGKPFENEARYRRADGEYRWFLVRAVPLRDGGGKIRKWYGTKTDIEDRKHAEQLQADLTHASRVSTMGELVASISHELAQPIMASTVNAKASLRWLQRDPPDLTEVRKGTESIIEAGTLASEIIDRLRSLYKKSSPKREFVAINEVIGEMVPLLRSEANEHAVSIRTDFAADLPKITADRVQLQQVLMNLILNGIEAMKETGGVLTMKSQLGEDGQIQISIHDTGPGLPLGKADQIFDAFFTTKPQGSGMGLSISKSIVGAHGGRIWATVNEGRGATFHFTLPAAPAETNPPVDAA